jgi:uncharacterized membrane-anchored protein YhcB (DUF1043 family)
MMKPANKIVIALLLVLFALLLAVLTPAAQTARLHLTMDETRAAQSRFVISWNEMGSRFADQAPLLDALNEDYRRNNPLLVVVPDDVRASQRSRRLLAWDQVITNEEAILKAMKDTRKAESEY